MITNQKSKYRLFDCIFPRCCAVDYESDFAGLCKDFTDTFKPDYQDTELLADIFQPVIGVLNFVVGIFRFLEGVLRLLAVVVFSPYALIESKSRWLTGLLCAGLRLIAGIAAIVRGFIQIITSPLAWLFKIPLRLFLTWHKEESAKTRNSISKKKLSVTDLEQNQNSTSTSYSLLSGGVGQNA